MAMDVVLSRSVAGAALALVLTIGGWTGARMTLATADAVEVALARQIDPDQAQREALDREASYRNNETFYQTRVDEAVARYELPAPPHNRLLEPNVLFHVASLGDTKTIAPGNALREAGFELRVVTESVDVERRGIRTKNTHTLARLRNTGERPLAYFLRMRSRDGDCQLRATTRYDAMVLLPDERAEISVCSGEHTVEVLDLRLMEVTELGALWVSKVPPQAVGHDPLVARSHFPGPKIEMCAEIPAGDLAARIEAGETSWEDIVDYYSRHDCEVYRWWPGYQRIVEPLASLPVVEG